MNPRSEQGPGYHSILIVEDDRAVRESLKFSLVIEGFAVRAYADAEQLLAETHLPKFDCMIVDQNMPGMNGLDLVSELRARHIDTPAILITSHPNQSRARSRCVRWHTYYREAIVDFSPRPCGAHRIAPRKLGFTGLAIVNVRCLQTNLDARADIRAIDLP